MALLPNLWSTGPALPSEFVQTAYRLACLQSHRPDSRHARGGHDGKGRAGQGRRTKGAQAKGGEAREGLSPLSTSNELRALFTLPFRLLDLLGKSVQTHSS